MLAKRYGLDGSVELEIQNGDLNKRLLMIAVVRELPHMTIADQAKSLARVEASKRSLKFVTPKIKNDKPYEECAVECWMSLIKAMANYSCVIYVAHPDVVSTDEVILNSIQRTGVASGVAIMILK